MHGLLSREIKPYYVVLNDMTDEIIAILDWRWWPYGGSNSYISIIQYKKPIKRQQFIDIWKTAMQAWTIPMTRTCEAEAEISSLFSVRNIIIIEYISFIHHDCMRSPHPIDEHRFNNKYDIILCTLCLLLDRIDREDQLFAAQWIWWLASINPFTEILMYNHYYKGLRSEYVHNMVVMPASNAGIAGSQIPEPQIRVVDIHVSDVEVHSGWSNLPPNYWSKMRR